MLVSSAARVFLVGLLAGSAAAQNEAPARPETGAAKPASAKDRLLAPDSDERARAAAAVELLASEPGVARDQLARSSRPDVLGALLDAIASDPNARPETIAFVPDLIALTRRPELEALRPQVVTTLTALHAKSPTELVAAVVARLDDSDAATVRAAADVLGALRDVGAIGPLVRLLRRTDGDGPLATAAGAALEAITLYPYGTNVMAWSQFLEQNGGKTRDRILEEMIARERVEKDEQLRMAEDEIVRLKAEAAEADPKRMVADLTYPLAQVRWNAARGLLVRGGDVDLGAAREAVLAGLESGTEPTEIVIAYLELLVVIDERAEPAPVPDERRDRVLATLVGDARSEVAIHAAEAAGHTPGPAVTEAVLAALKRLQTYDEPSDVRTALLKVTGRLGLVGAKDLLIAALRRDPGVDGRIAAATNLGALAIAEASADLEHALTADPEWRVRRRAAKPLAQVSGVAAVPALTQALSDAKPEVRAAVAEELAGLKTDAALAALLARLRVEDVVRGELVKAIGTTGDARATDAVTEQLIRAAPKRLDPPDAAEEPVWREARAALATLCGDDVARWSQVAAAAAAVDRPQLHAWIWGQTVRAFELQAEPDQGAYLAALLAQARAATRNLQWDAALAALDQADAKCAKVATADDRVIAMRERARAHAGAGRGLESTSAWNQALVLAKTASGHLARECAIEAARSFFDFGNAAACEDVLAPLADLADEDALLLARARRRNGRNDAAIAGLRELLARPQMAATPLELHARFELVEVLLDANDAAAALGELDRLDRQLTGSNDDASSLRSRELRKKASGAREPVEGDSNGSHRDTPAIHHGMTRTR
ncbi:MAG: HEAT repeat domain-containing protein [Planctomycetes bacterium]|nr:HEAT repeat domain-containing protein [Planctomycetota bacterium]